MFRGGVGGGNDHAGDAQEESSSPANPSIQAAGVGHHPTSPTKRRSRARQQQHGPQNGSSPPAGIGVGTPSGSSGSSGSSIHKTNKMDGSTGPPRGTPHRALHVSPTRGISATTSHGHGHVQGRYNKSTTRLALLFVLVVSAGLASTLIGTAWYGVSDSFQGKGSSNIAHLPSQQQRSSDGSDYADVPMTKKAKIRRVEKRRRNEEEETIVPVLGRGLQQLVEEDGQDLSRTTAAVGRRRAAAAHQHDVGVVERRATEINTRQDIAGGNSSGLASLPAKKKKDFRRKEIQQGKVDGGVGKAAADEEINTDIPTPLLVQLGGTVAQTMKLRTNRNKRDAAAKTSPFISGMGQNENDFLLSSAESDGKDKKSEEERGWTKTSPDPNALTSNGKIDIPQRQEAWEQKCIPMEEWQTTFHPTCNAIHEHDLESRSTTPSDDDNDGGNGGEEEMDVTLLSAGGSWRMAWRIRPMSDFLRGEESGGSPLVKKYNSIPDLLPPKQKQNLTNATSSCGNFTLLNIGCANSTTQAVKSPTAELPPAIDDSDYGHSSVLKMLRLDRPYNTATYRLHTTDVIAMERLTSSPFVVDPYGYCGESVLTELGQGSGRDLIKRTDLEPRKRLRMALNLAKGLSDIHGIDHPSGRNATFVHNDINLANLALVSSSSIKFNDFNIGVMSRWDAQNGKPCGHPVMFESPLWRAPEEIRDEDYVDEKVDIYSLGNVLFQVLTKHQPWTWLEVGGRPTLEEIGRKKMRGELPHFPAKYAESANMAEQALYIATLLCYTFDPERRPTAKHLSRSLGKAYIEFTNWRKGKRKEPLTFEELHDIFGLSNM